MEGSRTRSKSRVSSTPLDDDEGAVEGVVAAEVEAEVVLAAGELDVEGRAADDLAVDVAWASAGRERMTKRAGMRVTASRRARSAEAARFIFSPASSMPQVSHISCTLPMLAPVRPFQSSRRILYVLLCSLTRPVTR
jgi:hypothetical protein